MENIQEKYSDLFDKIMDIVIKNIEAIINEEREIESADIVAMYACASIELLTSLQGYTDDIKELIEYYARKGLELRMALAN